MVELTKEARTACLLRSVCGALFVMEDEDNEEGKKEAECTLSTLPLVDASVPRWHEELASWSKKHINLYPATIALDGLVYSLGTNYDEASSGEGVCSLFDLPPSTAAGDVIRDKIALAVDCPEMLVTLLYEMGSYVAIVGSESEKLASTLNWEACITLTGSFCRETMVESLCRKCGGADYVVERFPGEIVVPPLVEEMLSLRHGVLFALVDKVPEDCPTWVHPVVYGEPKQMMREICMFFRGRKSDGV